MSEENQIDEAVMALGKTEYAKCLTCHGATGGGVENLGPPLAPSEWVTGPAENLIRIQFRGLKGPIEVNGKTYEFPAGMWPVVGGSPDKNIAAVLTYVRNSFGNEASVVTPEMVAAHRGEMGKGQLTVADLIDPRKDMDKSGPKAEVPPSTLGAPTMGIIMTLVIVGLSVLAALRMKAVN